LGAEPVERVRARRGRLRRPNRRSVNALLNRARFSRHLVAPCGATDGSVAMRRAGVARAEAQQLRGGRGGQGRPHPRLVDREDGPRPPPLPTGPSTKEGRSTFFTPDIIVPVSPAAIG
jgi:hypothetical protein